MIHQRASLLAQSVESLRLGIANGQWVDVLPPERLLCEQLEISRSTLRRAIDKITEEGLIDHGRSGKRRKILAKPDPSSVSINTNKRRSMVWLTRKPLQEIPSVNLRLIAQLQSRLSNHNCLLHVMRIPEKALYHPEIHMSAWLKEFPADVWILHLMPVEVQQWFCKHHPVACVIGSRAPDIELASIEIDSLAAMNHAVTVMRRQGHQHIGLVRAAEHLVGEDRLEQVLKNLASETLQVSVITCPTEPSHIAAEFEKVFRKKEGGVPTALICSISHVALFALTWLQQHGISVPGDLSIILLRSQPILDYTSPSFAHYTIHEERAVTQIFPRLLDLLQSQVCSTSHINLIPEFVAGDSLAVRSS